ncbi:uncharacterized protein BX663DRAFT_555172 [Cokeromyces recurvatus]|uniref:uncharacterized protein n=1 Tax=Cokeromyces recurvatus TaxID=90255 RepID=UPI0022209B06|nr:uncharacterized protein BX663DRAFT_555172 [Cokeromyces recurvatus]KAI7899314.1 hypothetical protein BX663DRAFT_555172 [Cokeromyces recurvatus]
MTVGELRDLHDKDWIGIGLTVFALHALKNMLQSKRHAILSKQSSCLHLVRNSSSTTTTTLEINWD